MQAQQGIQVGVWELVVNSGPLVKFVLLILIFASVVCWGVIVAKHWNLRLAGSENQKFLKLFWGSKSLDDIFAKAETFTSSPIATLFKSGFKELKKLNAEEGGPHLHSEVENIERAIARASNAEVAELEKYVSWLATTASAAPFIGLFGTVWGIMNSFHNIGATGSANLSVVAPGISEALISTAVGLGAAIPAVIAYNHFGNRIKTIVVDMDCFSQDFLNIVQRGLLSRNRGKKSEG